MVVMKALENRVAHFVILNAVKNLVPHYSGNPFLTATPYHKKAEPSR